MQIYWSLNGEFVVSPELYPGYVVLAGFKSDVIHSPGTLQCIHSKGDARYNQIKHEGYYALERNTLKAGFQIKQDDSPEWSRLRLYPVEVMFSRTDLEREWVPPTPAETRTFWEHLSD